MDLLIFAQSSFINSDRQKSYCINIPTGPDMETSFFIFQFHYNSVVFSVLKTMVPQEVQRIFFSILMDRPFSLYQNPVSKSGLETSRGLKVVVKYRTVCSYM